jgi:hypothetical protein
MKHLALFAGAALALSTTATAAAQGTGALTGTLVGDSGGAYQTWNVTLPADTKVTLTLSHWPCQTGESVGLNVWGASGLLAHSWESDACTQKAWFNSGSGGMAEIQLFDYLHGVGTWWSLSAEGITLGGSAPAQPAPVAAEAKPAEAAGTTMSASTAAATTTTAAAPKASSGLLATDTIFGDTAGAFDNYNLTVEEGKSYTVRMTVGTDWGGNWPGVGFDVWGPQGHVASGAWTSTNTLEATFKATGNVVYLVQPFNYHHGLTLFYTIETVPSM